VLGSIPFVLRLGSEFMPPLDEGSLLFMPVTLPDVSNNEAKRILQVQDKLIMSIPEVENVLGKAGRAYTATDNAPMSMIESIILLKPKSEWRKGMTTEKLITELNDKCRYRVLQAVGHSPSSTVSTCFQPECEQISV
jgi:Cu(I)/Ag(I) efflux system membrane protein CusA/SilA